MVEILEACYKNDIVKVKYLVENGADVNEKCNESALHIACRNNNIEIVKYLVDKGADVNMQDKSNESSLHIACRNNNIEIVTYLVDNGSDVNSKGMNDVTPLDIACYKNNIEILKYLVDKGANVNPEDAWGRTVRYLSCTQDNINLVKYLFENGLDVNIQDAWGRTVLYIACENDNKDLIKYLEDNGGTFGEEIEKVYSLFHECPEKIREEVHEFIENNNKINFPFSNIELFNVIVSFENIPDKYKYFLSEEFKEKMVADVINQHLEDTAEYKGRLLFYMKGVDHVQEKVRKNLKRLETINI